MAAVVTAGSVLAACSSGPIASPAADMTGGLHVIAARVLADDPAFPAGAAKRPRFVPCHGLSGCARRAADTGDYYPGLTLPAEVDVAVDHSVEFVIYLVGARFDEADLDGDTVRVKLIEREGGFQMVKLDGRDLGTIRAPMFAFVAGSRTICSSSWGGCG